MRKAEAALKAGRTEGVESERALRARKLGGVSLFFFGFPFPQRVYC